MRHECHADGCTIEVPRRMFMCHKHWGSLPAGTKREIWRHYRVGQEEGRAPVTKEYLKVTREAIAWVAEKERKDVEEKNRQGKFF